VIARNHLLCWVIDGLDFLGGVDCEGHQIILGVIYISELDFRNHRVDMTVSRGWGGRDEASEKRKRG